MKYTISQSQYNKSILKLRVYGCFYLLFNLLGIYLVPYCIPVSLLIMIIYVIYYKKTCARLKDVFRNQNQYIEFHDNSFDLLCYDTIQNDAVCYMRETPIMHHVLVSKINKLHISPFSICMFVEGEETVLRRNPFTVHKQNLKIILYPVFGNYKNLMKRLRGFHQGTNKGNIK